MGNSDRDNNKVIDFLAYKNKKEDEELDALEDNLSEIVKSVAKQIVDESDHGFDISPLGLILNPPRQRLTAAEARRYNYLEAVRYLESAQFSLYALNKTEEADNLNNLIDQLYTEGADEFKV